MHATTTTIPTSQRVTEPIAVCNAQTTLAGAPANHNGPQCAHCGWRGGEHAPKCIFNPAACRRNACPPPSHT